jgi:hypothetical protein
MFDSTITDMAKKRGLEAQKGTRRSERVAKRTKLDAAGHLIHDDPTSASTAAPVHDDLVTEPKTASNMAQKRGHDTRQGSRRSERVAKRSKVEAADLPVQDEPTTAPTAAVAVAIAGPALPTAITEPMQETALAHVVEDKSTEKRSMEDTADAAVNDST